MSEMEDMEGHIKELQEAVKCSQLDVCWMLKALLEIQSFPTSTSEGRKYWRIADDVIKKVRANRREYNNEGS